MAVMIKVTKIWKNKSVSVATKVRLMKALVWQVASATFGCEAWTLRKQEKRSIQAFENKCIRKLLRMPWTNLDTASLQDGWNKK